MRVNYDIDYFCDSCVYSFPHSKGIRCPKCKRRARTGPRVKKNMELPRI